MLDVEPRALHEGGCGPVEEVMVAVRRREDQVLRLLQLHELVRVAGHEAPALGAPVLGEEEAAVLVLIFRQRIQKSSGWMFM